jgi:UDP-glucose 4-epimerase
MQNNILLTGATGYIASHTWVELLNAGYSVIGIDNFSNSSPEVLHRIEKITNKNIQFIQGDICDKNFLQDIFSKYNINSIIHFAAHKAVGESVSQPLKYYQNNIGGLINLLDCALNINNKNIVKNFVFSSSATVYGQPKSLPIKEDAELYATNPYGQTKLMSEQILNDIAKANPDFNIAILRYFNPIGAHESGLIGEAPNGVPNNIMPYITQVAVGIRKHLSIFGNDYNTKDGTGVRDYIHVVDLALGHLKALDYLQKQSKNLSINLGTGHGYSVFELVSAFEKASNTKINYEFSPRRDGDVESCYADASLAYTLINWKTKYNLDDMCEHSWNWQKNNPDGY